MLPPAEDMDMLLLATDMDMLLPELPELPMVEMLLIATDTDMLLPELPMGDMLLLSHGYRYALVGPPMGAHSITAQE